MSNDLPDRHTIRLTGYDYSESGWYFITICTQNRECILGDIVGGEMILNDVGKIVDKWLIETSHKFDIVLDKYQIMPNHIHTIIHIPAVRADLCVRPNDNESIPPYGSTHMVFGRTHRSAPTIGTMIQWFKTMVTNEYIQNVKNNNWKRFDKRLFQRNFYEHIIRNQTEHTKIHEYISQNPAMWDQCKGGPLCPPYNDTIKPHHPKSRWSTTKDPLSGFDHETSV